MKYLCHDEHTQPDLTYKLDQYIGLETNFPLQSHIPGYQLLISITHLRIKSFESITSSVM